MKTGRVTQAFGTGILLMVLAHDLGAAEPPAAAPAAARAAHWAVPMSLDGVPNLHQITPTLYRSEQPTALGFKNLEKLGIRTVINLRAFNSDDDEVRGTSLRTERVRILTWNVDDDQVIAVMRMLRNTGNGPFLIHCQHGADRTGLMSAMYRILEQGWTVDDALAELTGGGYGYHAVWKNILRYVRSADVEKLRAAVVAVSSPMGSTATVTDN
jgi:protein tyrosine/serine phosphatase